MVAVWLSLTIVQLSTVRVCSSVNERIISVKLVASLLNPANNVLSVVETDVAAYANSIFKSSRDFFLPKHVDTAQQIFKTSQHPIPHI